MTAALNTPGLLSLAAGFTDNRTLPIGEVSSAVGAMRAKSGEPEHLQYGLNQGRTDLRQRLAQQLMTLEPELEADTLRESMLVTNGSQQALYLAAQVLCDPGDIVLVDRPSYFVFLEMLAGLGVRAKSLPVNPAGRIDAAALDRLLSDLRTSGEVRRVKAVYFVSYFCNPSARSLDEAEKLSIAQTLQRHELTIPVIEDAAYRELYFRSPEPAKSVLTLPEWAEFPRLYASTLTKPFATGLKVGYGVCTDKAWLEKMLCVKGHHDFGTANFNQALFAQVLANGGYDRQLAIIRPHYERKMRALQAVLERGGLRRLGWSWDEPAGGLYLWLRAPERLDTRMEGAFCRACIESGVLYVPGDLCFGDDAPFNYVRLSFGVLDGAELEEAGNRFVAAARRFA